MRTKKGKTTAWGITTRTLNFLNASGWMVTAVIISSRGTCYLDYWGASWRSTSLVITSPTDPKWGCMTLGSDYDS